MNRQSTLESITACLLFLALVGCVHANEAPENRKLNVLFLIADDLNRHLPCYGHDEVIAPNVARLAKRAVRFDRAYCQYPVCSPSRVSFLSGRRPERTGMFGNNDASRTPLLQDAVFLPEHFRQHGYFTARFGKVFHIGRDVSECWDVSEEGSTGTKPVYQPQEVEKLGLASKVVATHRLEGGGGEGASYAILSGDDDSLIDVRNARRTAELVKQKSKGPQPFFIACGFRRPHLPHIAPQRYFDMYPVANMPLPAKTIANLPVPMISGLNGPVNADDHREALRGYLACVSFMDAQLGIVLDAIDESNQWDRTIIVLIGDHGYLLGDRGGWWGKNVLYEDSAATTLLIAAPDSIAITAGRDTLVPTLNSTRANSSFGISCKRVVEFVDLYPTLATLCGLPTPNGLDGRDLSPLLRDPNREWNHPAFTMMAAKGTPAGLAVSTERYRYLEHDDGRAELFDLQTDPGECRSVLNDAAHAAHQAKLINFADQYKARFRGKTSP